jgi:hypothetical protein
MSIAKHAQASRIMANLSKAKYTSANKGGKFHDYGSVLEDSLLAQQAHAERRYALLQKKRA